MATTASPSVPVTIISPRLRREPYIGLGMEGSSQVVLGLGGHVAESWRGLRYKVHSELALGHIVAWLGGVRAADLASKRLVSFIDGRDD